MKSLLLKVAAMAALFTLIGCGTHDIAEDDIKWSDDNGGTLEVGNLSNKDVVLFFGQVPMPESIMGGVRAGATKTFDVSKYVSDFSAGGYTVLRGITREQYNEHKYNLSAAKVEFNAFATYRAGTKYRIEISYNYIGDNVFRVTNKGRIGLELRKNGPDGEKVTYLPRLEVNQMIYTQTTDAITLFPVYVFYNKSTQEINTIHATSHFEAVMASPRPATSAGGIQTYTFPNDETLTWDKIVGTLESPVAYIKVQNNVRNQSIYFAKAGSNHLISQNGYDAIGSGEILTFEVEATKEGLPLDLTAKVYNGVIEKGITFEGQTTMPVIKNGYNYTVTISGGGQDISGYTATIVETGERDLSDQLESL